MPKTISKSLATVVGMIFLLTIAGIGGVMLWEHYLTTTSPKATGLKASGLPFKDDFSDTSSGWPHLAEADYDTSAGAYRIAPSSGTPASSRLLTASIPKVGDLDDAKVEVDAASTGDATKEGDWGIVCRISPGADNANFYGLGIRNDGSPTIFKVKDHNVSLLSEPRIRSEKVTDPSATNHIRGDCVGDKLTLYVNDQKVAEASDNEFTSGGVGLYANSFESGTNVLFDNFSVSEP